MDAMTAGLGCLFLALFMAAQGGAIFATAFLALRALKIDGWVGKLVAMHLSWAAWVTVTIGGYVAIGGEGGFMDGAMMLILPLLVSPFSSAVYTALWLLAPKLRQRAF